MAKKITLGSKIKELRTLEGLSQTALARKIGKKPHYINQVEKDVFHPSLKTLDDIAAALRTRPCILLDDSIPPSMATPIGAENKLYVDKLLIILKRPNDKCKFLIKTLLDALTSEQK